MLSQFSPENGKHTLANLTFTFPKDVYPVGRLDADSEGLLFLTNDHRVNSKLLDPTNKHARTYLVQVEGKVSTAACDQLAQGLVISVNGRAVQTLPAKASVISAPDLPARTPPIRYRKNIPDSWLTLTLREGKNRQVRKMTAKVGYPTLRLVRWSIGQISLGKMQPGEVREIEPNELPLLFEKI